MCDDALATSVYYEIVQIDPPGERVFVPQVLYPEYSWQTFAIHTFGELHMPRFPYWEYYVRAHVHCQALIVLAQMT